MFFRMRFELSGIGEWDNGQVQPNDDDDDDVRVAAAFFSIILICLACTSYFFIGPAALVAFGWQQATSQHDVYKCARSRIDDDVDETKET